VQSVLLLWARVVHRAYARVTFCHACSDSRRSGANANACNARHSVAAVSPRKKNIRERALAAKVVPDAVSGGVFGG